MRSFNKTAATLVRPNPFSTLCTTTLGKMTLCLRILFHNMNIYASSHDSLYAWLQYGSQAVSLFCHIEGIQLPLQCEFLNAFSRKTMLQFHEILFHKYRN